MKCKRWATVLGSLTRVLLLVAALACSSSLPEPELGRHPLAAFKEAPYPPPAALAETIPPRPERDGAVWIDGEWVLRGASYAWRRGAWVVPPPAARFAPWQAFYRRDGRLMLATGAWYDEKDERTRRPQPLAPASTPPNDITSEFQTGR